MSIVAFSSTIFGPASASTVGSELWINLGLIPTGYGIWVGSAKYSVGKSATFELRTNLTGQSAGTLAATKILSSVAVTAKSGVLTVDMYKRGTLHIATVHGTGTEHWWLRIVSKTSTAALYTYQYYYTTE